MGSTGRPPSPVHLFETINSFQKTEALKAAVELEFFTAIAEGHATAADLAQRCGVASRGARILCDYLVIQGFLTKSGEKYALTEESAQFLDQKSPTYLGGAMRFLLSPVLRKQFAALTDAVRYGGTAVDDHGTTAPGHPVWVDFARSMAPMMMMAADAVAKTVVLPNGRPSRVLDIAAGHGLFGVLVLKQNPQARMTAIDWPTVLEVARENAAHWGVADRYETIAGSAFEVELGGGYDLALVPNFLHHFNPGQCQQLLLKLHAALAPGGRIVILEFVPNEDRVTPLPAAAFALIMLASTPAGDAYTFSELDRMLRSAGFTGSELRPLPPSPHSVVTAHRA